MRHPAPSPSQTAGAAVHGSQSAAVHGSQSAAGAAVHGCSVLLLGLVLAACGVSPDDGTPNDPFDPGKRPPPGNYGSGGSGSGGMPMDTPPMCDPSERRCGHEFVYQGSLMMPLSPDIDHVELHGDYAANGWTAGNPMTFDGKVYRVIVPVPWNGKVLYKFRLVYKNLSDKWIPDPQNPEQVDDGLGGKNSLLTGVTCAKWTCAADKPMCSGPGMPGAFDWRDAVLYFVFVDRFYNGDPKNDMPVSAPNLDAAANWQGGDWAGVTKKIKEGYFTSLGINTLWLTVPMDQTDGTGLGTDGHLYTAYHGYWPRDLTQPGRRFGSDAELKNLTDEAHKAGLRIILDYAMNHVHKDSPVWQAHMNDGWFNPLGPAGNPCICGSAACGWDGDKAKVCWFADYLPDFNFANAEARKYSVDNALSWVQKSGADGLRLDAIKHIELSWLTDLRSRLSTDVEPVTKEHVYLVGETFSGDQNLIRSFIDPCKQLDGQFDFPLRAAINSKILMRQGSMKDLIDFMDKNTGFYGSGVMSTFLGNHDVPRIIHFAQNTPLWNDPWVDGKDHNWTHQPGLVSEMEAYQRVAVAMAVLLTNRGVPLIYYGDEVGLPGAGDPDNRRFMQWDGYSAGQTALLGRLKKLTAQRAAHGALRHGDRTTLSFDNDTWAYKMVEGTDTVYVAVNRGDGDKTVAGLPTGPLHDPLTGETLTGPSVSIPARGVRLLLP